MTTRVNMIIETLKAYPNQFFTAKKLAELFIQRYPKEIEKKRSILQRKINFTIGR